MFTNRNTKSLIIFLALVLLVMIPLQAKQQLYDGSSKEYIETRRLCQYVGVVGPSSALPVNADELLIALDRIDRSSLPDYLQTRYDALYASLEPLEAKASTYEFPIVFSPQAFISTEQNKDRDAFFIPFRDEKSLLDIGIRLNMADYVFLESAFPIRNEPPRSHVPYSSFDFFFIDNTMWFQCMPLIARGSVGTDVFSAYIGRTRHSFGNGYTGNLLVGDNYAFQEVLDLKYTSNTFTYNISTTHFDTQQLGDTSQSRSDSFWDVQFDNPHFNGMQQTRVVHRFDINFANKVRTALNLGTLYYGSSSFDARWYIPFIVAHSYYNYAESEIINPESHDESNNIISLEVEYPVYPRFNLSCQIIMDQYQNKQESDIVPDALGGMLSFSFVELGKRVDYEAFIEAVYTYPYLYIAPKQSKNDKTGQYEYNWNYDFYLGYYTYQDGRSAENAPSSGGAWSGYGYGPNTALIACGLNTTDNKINLDTQTLLMYYAQGDINSSINYFYDTNHRNEWLLGPVTHNLKFQEKVNYQVLPSLDLMGALELSYAHKEGNNKFGCELYLGLSWRII